MFGNVSHSVEFLEHQYSPSRWSKLVGPKEIIKDHCERTLQASKHAIKVTKNELDVKYGNLNGSRLDLFFPSECEKDTDCPVLVFIHGGYWQELGKQYFSFLGQVFCPSGIVVAVVGYDLAPEVKLGKIVKEMQESVVYLHKEFPNSKLFIAGSSAGGHLAALLLKENWTLFGLPEFPIRGVIPISGIFDLKPLVRTYINEHLKMDEKEADMLSPMKYIKDVSENSNCSVLCLIGEYESDEFYRQSKEYCKALQDVGIEASFKVIEKTDHFSIVHDLLDAGYEGKEIIINFIKQNLQETHGCERNF